MTGILKVTQLVHQADGYGLTPGENSSVGKAANLLDIEFSSLRHGGDKLLMYIIDQGLKDFPIPFGHGTNGGSDILVLTTFDNLAFEPDLFEQLLKIGELQDNPDTPRDGAGIGENAVGRAGNVIAPRSGNRSHGDDYRLYFDGLLDLLADLLRRADTAHRGNQS